MKPRLTKESLTSRIKRYQDQGAHGRDSLWFEECPKLLLDDLISDYLTSSIMSDPVVCTCGTHGTQVLQPVANCPFHGVLK